MHDENPWQCHGVKQIFQNDWIRLEVHEVTNPAGRPNDYGKVCFKNKAVGIIPIDEYNNTWLVGQYRYTLDEYSWEIPEGGSAAGEAPLETARRELLEETGLVADQFELLLKLHTSNSVTDEEGYLYIARSLTANVACPDETEVLRVKKLPLKDAVAMAMSGEITDSLSLAGLLKVAQLGLC